MRLPEAIERELQAVERELDRRVRDIGGQMAGPSRLRGLRSAIESSLAAGLSEAPAPQEKRPKVICLCGSTKFIEQFATATWELELRGVIVLGCTLLPWWFCGVRDHFAEKQGVKEQRDSHHKQKIDLADEVVVLDIGGYIGESTRSEIAYAKATGKPVSYVSKDPELLARILPALASPAPPKEPTS